MSIRNLKYLFDPQSVAVIGASQRPHSVGATVLNNIVEGNFRGKIFPVNPKYGMLGGLEVYAKVRDLPAVPDLAVICTPPETVPGLIGELGEHGTKAAIVLTAGLGAIKDWKGRNLKQAMLDAAQPHLLRILGPNCVGLLAPAIGLNASFAHAGALPGKIGFVSQSGALMTGVLDWAKSRGIGFSKFISLGDSADVDFGDVLDYLASDAGTHAILLYIEDIRHARKFMSAARAAARSKPVLVVKAGRAPEGAKAAASHTGALAGSDAVYDAAIRRAGMLRVLSTEDLFGTVETLAHARPIFGDKLSIMTNGGGPGVMATDALICSTGRLAALSAETLQELDRILPPTWSHGNPVDIIGDAPAERYVQTMEALLRDPQSDAILFIHAPTAIVPSSDIARQLVPLAQHAPRNVIACWFGGDAVALARHTFAEAGIPTYDTPEGAVNGFMQIVQYRRNQNLLMEVPPSLATDFTPDRDTALAIVRNALERGTHMLSEPDAKTLLAAYGIPVVATRSAATVDDAVQCAQQIGFPVALKILSPDITHKTDVGGVVLDLETPDAVHSAASAMLKRLHDMRPGARLHGFSVQTMVRRPQAHELIVGVTTDPVFGPVILFGQGGIAVEVTADHAIGLPPLNMVLAREMVCRTRVAKLLAGYRNRPAANIDAIGRTLVQVSQLVADIAEIAELDINPLLADCNGVIALDARVRLAPSVTPTAGVERFAIRPYPQELEEWITWQGQQLLLRPIRPEDGTAHVAFFNALDPEDVRYRMFIGMRELQPSQLARLTQIDYDREMAFIATRKRENGEWETLGVARVIADPDNVVAEFAIIVRSDLKRQGLGRILMEKLIDYCRRRGTQQIVGEALSHNRGVLNLASHFGFDIVVSKDPGTLVMRLDLLPQSASV
ncbi:MAG TPA: bifunctional acetate--CoA ligase family protein/GNAT family N-acetyltransferase [Noviherbaspirillum sp.]|nr:bifunctional acetate--CoA ligase family protein/GNAT family N-acetyltransferase [Noviherbaspirillum sp.]